MQYMQIYLYGKESLPRAFNPRHHDAASDVAPLRGESVVLWPISLTGPSGRVMMRYVKLGRGHQRSTGMGHRGSRHGRCANIHCSKYYFRSL